MSCCGKSEPCRIRVATFNTGDFIGRGFERGSAEAVAAYRELIQAVGADLWALQEDVEFFNDETRQGVYEAIYDTYRNYERRFTGPYNGKAFLSNLEIRDVEQVYYECTKRVGHKWFLRGTVSLGGHEVCLIGLHLDWSDNEVRHQQIEQVIAYAAQYEYVIIMGDFNPDDYIDGVKQSERNLMEEEVTYFTAAGYTPANAGAFGLFDTWVAKSGLIPIDNILVSGNIRIEAVDRVHRDWMRDHTPLWADIVID